MTTEFKYTESFMSTRDDKDGTWILVYGGTRTIYKGIKTYEEAVLLTNFCTDVMRPWMEKISCDMRDFISDIQTKHNEQVEHLEKLLEGSDNRIDYLEGNCRDYLDEIDKLEYDLAVNHIPRYTHDQCVNHYERKIEELEDELYRMKYTER